MAPREWLGALYDRRAAGLYRYAVMILADTEAAADAVQQVFTRLVDPRLDRPEVEAHYLRPALPIRVGEDESGVMNDEELERKLRRFRLVAPPARLRTTIVDRAGRRVVSASAWMPTAAALMAATVLYWLSASERAAVRVSVDQAAAARAANVNLVARSLGGGPQSMLVAGLLVSLDEPRPEASR